MSDAFSEFYIPPDVSTTPAPDQSFTFGSPTLTSPVDVGTAGQYAGSFGGVQLPQAPAFDVSTISAAPAQGFTPTDTGYTPTFDFSAYNPSYGQPVPYQGASSDTLSALLSGVQSAGLQPRAYNVAGLTSDIERLPTISGGAGGFQPNLYSTPAGPPMPTVSQLQQLAAESQQPSPTDTTKQPSPLDSILGKMSGGDIVKLLTGGVGGLMSYLGAQKAQQQAADAAAEYRQAAQTAAQQYRDVAAPYITAGAPQLSMALQGALSPAQLQQYQAGQARLAQAAAKSGGIGAIQTAAAEQALYNNALQQQQTMALQLLGQGDPYLSDAIKAELAGTQGGLEFELKYGAQAATALGQMMASLGSSVGRTA
jgi:hypothetical protein